MDKTITIKALNEYREMIEKVYRETPIKTLEQLKAEIEAYKEDYRDSTKPKRVARLEQICKELLELAEYKDMYLL